MTARSTHLVLVPGLGCTEDLFAEQIASLRGEVAISVADHTRHDTMSGIARAVLATAPNRFALCGLSMGGSIAFEMMRQASDRIERLALRAFRHPRADRTAPPANSNVTDQRIQIRLRHFMAVAIPYEIPTENRDLTARTVEQARKAFESLIEGILVGLLTRQNLAEMITGRLALQS